MVKRPVVRLSLALLALLLAGCAHQGPAPSPSAGYTLKLPPGPGPFPAVVLLHGCSGVGKSMPRWAERLNRWGYAALIVDSFGPRGLKTVCGQGHLVSPETDRTADAYRAAEYLRGLAAVDPGRVAVIGFSHGGATVMSLVQPGRAEAHEARPFRAAVAYYPSCRPQRHGGVDTPLLILIGDKDDWTPARFCQELMAHLRRPELVELKIYPEAYHAFDALGPARTYLGHFMVYDRAAAEDSFALTKDFLARKLN